MTHAQRQQEKGRDTCHVVPKGTMGGTKGWSACGGIERCPVSSQPSHCSPRGPRRLTTVPASPTESPEQADSVSRLSVHCPSSVPQSLAEVRWPVCGPWASVQPGPMLSSESLAYAQRTQFSRPGVCQWRPRPWAESPLSRCPHSVVASWHTKVASHTPAPLAIGTWGPYHPTCRW